MTRKGGNEEIDFFFLVSPRLVQVVVAAAV